MQIVLIYGRRRVGKSELVKQLLKDTSCQSIYYECRQVAEESATGINCQKYVFISKSPVDLEGVEDSVEVINLKNMWD